MHLLRQTSIKNFMTRGFPTHSITRRNEGPRCVHQNKKDSKMLPEDMPIEEETLADYETKQSLQLRPKDLLIGRSEMLLKMGWKGYPQSGLRRVPRGS